MNVESTDDLTLKIKDHYAAMLSEAPSEYLVKYSSELTLFTNKYVYSFPIPNICTSLGTSRSNIAPGPDGIPT